ncbi:MAG: ABC transporter ATP-binding protein [Alphaproteobacteria bacterium]|nr:ABC transporter ATP-binding protein [Alphaproteobacteria bacterium]OJV12484.1 MAG: hypothetical protein BGO27_07105 [Alphaproteobacteria bacterium 33-17]
MSMLANKKSNFTDNNPILEISRLSKRFDGQVTPTLDDINLTIYEGEFFALLGPSGCGKTTLMRMIGGFDNPDVGIIRIDDKDITNSPASKRPVNMMFQSYALFPHMNVFENIAFGLRQEGLDQKTIDERVDNVLEIVKMKDFKSRSIEDLSGGQQQRVALARCIAKRPKIIMLDEPLGALDLKTKEHTQFELMNIQHMLGITFIMVTHNQQEAMAMANRMAIMDKGRILQIGTPQEIYDYPNSLFVADFIGTINMFEAFVEEVDDHEDYSIVRLIEFNDLRVKISLQNRFQAGTNVYIGIRPEEFIISKDQALADENFFKAKVLDISFLGDQLIYQAETAHGKVITATTPTAAGSRQQDIKIDDEIFLGWHDTDGTMLIR